MVIFMPYYRQNGHLFHSRTRSSSISNGQNNPSPPPSFQLNSCQIASNILCRFVFSLFLLIIAIFLLKLSIDTTTNQNEGSPIIATILLTIAIVSFIRTYQKLRQYYIIMDTRRQLIQRLHERQQALSLNNNEFLNTGLPSYRELFPSHLNLTTTSNESLPSYDDYVKTLVIHHSTTNLSLPTQSQSQCIWITDRTRRPLCIRGTVTYV